LLDLEAIAQKKPQSLLVLITLFDPVPKSITKQ